MSQHKTIRTTHRALWSMTTLALCAVTSTAQAGDFTPRGTIDSSQAALAVSFDELPSAEVFSQFISYQNQPIPTASLVLDEEGLEGQGALELRSEQDSFIMAPGEEWDQFIGRRVEVTLWYKPQGTEPRVTLEWVSGSQATLWAMGHESVDAFHLASTTFHPTGRATDDGWIELTSGPFDYALGGKLAPKLLTVRDVQHLGSTQRRRYPFAQDASVLLDALEVADLGPARVPEATCHGANEAMTCGDGGACMLGQCVDGAVAFGHVPDGTIGDTYLERRLFELRAFSGPRAGRENLSRIEQMVRELDRDSPRSFWHGLSLAHELALDGHGRPPRDIYLTFANISGVCLGLGQADLSPVEARRVAKLPMVFSADAEFAPGATLKRGDVLVEVDGLDVWDWTALHPMHFYYNGDPEGRAISDTRQLVDVAHFLGSTLTFERCNRLDGAPCDATQAETIEIDLAEQLGAVWHDTPSDDIYLSRNDCDMRFERHVELSGEAGDYFTAESSTIGQITHLLINSFPRTDEQGRWERLIDDTLDVAPPYVVIDQRLGYGGVPAKVLQVLSHLLDPSNDVRAFLVPWLGQALDESTFEALRGCAQTHAGSRVRCGGFGEFIANEGSGTGHASSSKLAVLNGFSISGHDFLSKFLTYRQAPTRFFGYGPIMGAYGNSCSFATYLWERSPMRYQCNDTRFAPSAQDPADGFQSGMGVRPDEIIFQLQSDALAGEDTMIKAAHQWLLSTDEEVTP